MHKPIRSGPFERYKISKLFLIEEMILGVMEAKEFLKDPSEAEL